jgi:hypothetical protein
MPSGSEEPQRDPALKRKAWLTFLLCPVLGGGCSPGLEILGLNMAVTVRTETVKQMCQHRHGATQKRKDTCDHCTASWKLTPQQQAFIDVFAEDEPKNNNLVYCVMMQIV